MFLKISFLLHICLRLVDYQCGGQIKLCQNCSEPRSEQNNCHNGSSCIAYSEKDPVILTSKNKTSVIHDDTIADCCWRVYSGRGYNGKSRLISGRLNIPGPTETKCEDVGFVIQSLQRCVGRKCNK